MYGFSRISNSDITIVIHICVESYGSMGNLMIAIYHSVCNSFSTLPFNFLFNFRPLKSFFPTSKPILIDMTNTLMVNGLLPTKMLAKHYR